MPEGTMVQDVPALHHSLATTTQFSLPRDQTQRPLRVVLFPL